ncbi:MAG: prefoldin subunit beta [Candidatus Nanoarchaeia archaeon]|jgi:prefoldin beta subunit|nr:prefoldin subunit beta [Candidatus Nanoarchaeia archaeon]|tara:strand:- start:3719 stop:4051 length:333 start_codon:yes stop_codon:yes gene_type:complete
MDVSKETEKDIAQLQLLEQNLQNFLAQKQTFQTQLLKIDNALKELNSTKEDSYKIVGNIMIKDKKENLIKDLQSKKEIVELRLKTLDKQETKIKDKAEELQKKVVKELEK